LANQHTPLNRKKYFCCLKEKIRHLIEKKNSRSKYFKEKLFWTFSEKMVFVAEMTKINGQILCTINKRKKRFIVDLENNYRSASK